MRYSCYLAQQHGTRFFFDPKAWENRHTGDYILAYRLEALHLGDVFEHTQFDVHDPSTTKGFEQICWKEQFRSLSVGDVIMDADGNEFMVADGTRVP